MYVRCMSDAHEHAQHVPCTTVYACTCLRVQREAEQRKARSAAQPRQGAGAEGVPVEVQQGARVRRGVGAVRGTRDHQQSPRRGGTQPVGPCAACVQQREEQQQAERPQPPGDTKGRSLPPVRGAAASGAKGCGLGTWGLQDERPGGHRCTPEV